MSRLWGKGRLLQVAEGPGVHADAARQRSPKDDDPGPVRVEDRRTVLPGGRMRFYGSGVQRNPTSTVAAEREGPKRAHLLRVLVPAAIEDHPVGVDIVDRRVTPALVWPVGELGPECIVTPGIFVQRLVKGEKYEIRFE